MKKYAISKEELIKNNRCLGDLFLENSNIKFLGRNNILFINGNVKLQNSSIEFRGDNNLIYLCSSNDTLILDIKIYNNSTFYFGKENWINRGIKIVISEQNNVFFGNDNLISYDICIRTADPHLLYDSKSYKRINYGKSIYIGDHVWIGQHVMILKNTHIGSGTTIGAMSLLSGKNYESNCVYAGVPAKKVKEDVFFLKNDSHRFLDEDIKKYDTFESNLYIYEKDNSTLDFVNIENKLKKMTVIERVDYLTRITNINDKNRFCIKK